MFFFGGCILMIDISRTIFQGCVGVGGFAIRDSSAMMIRPGLGKHRNPQIDANNTVETAVKYGEHIIKNYHPGKKCLSFWESQPSPGSFVFEHWVPAFLEAGPGDP